MRRIRHALITGGSRGIGLAIAQLFASKSYRITLVSRTSSDLQVALKSLPPLSSSIPSPSPTDSEAHRIPPSHSCIASPIDGLAATLPTHLPIEHEDSKIDVLVNCAGMTQERLFISMSDAQVENIIDTNLTSMMTLTKYLLRRGYFYGTTAHKKMIPVIINVASLLGVQGGLGAVAYAASKAGVLGFTRALALETGGMGIRVNALVPGYIDTDMTSHLNTSNLHTRIPLARFGRPEEVADAAWFLANNQYAHNCVLNLDGGLSAT
ncbi:NAD(P)-binding protein [Amniculicola lignicola CBS 123094]|uniref:NAD(P)-binding protein n=1 Tax=Amniculicola lignicola CBS 123094 TaxID=1392246 RepID=A0A6A5WN14_9PLEO|nr:NAD(P)-binding protein [Amniculicola lignicola CBS 123094]